MTSDDTGTTVQEGLTQGTSSRRENAQNAGLGCGTLTSSQPGLHRPQRGLVAGHALKLARESAGLTQERLAELAGADKTTIQGWESGRRPLGSVSAGSLVQLRQLLLDVGAAQPLAAAIDTAVDADLLLDRLLDHDQQGAGHGLANRVLSRELVDLLTWPVKSNRPAIYRDGPPVRRRGPVAAGPQLSDDERRTLFQNLRSLADTAAADDEGALLRRQAYYLASFDTAEDLQAWLSSLNRRINWARHANTWTPRWAEARSIATSLARSGDVEALDYFVEAGRGDDGWELANLNYFAYWVGEVRSHHRDDSFMRHTDGGWRGNALLAHLALRLEPDSPLLPLNARTLWSLVASRRGLLEEHPDVSRRLARRVEAALDCLPVAAHARVDLHAVQAALTLAGIRASSE